MRETLLSCKITKNFRNCQIGRCRWARTVRGCLHSYPHSPDQTSLFRMGIMMVYFVLTVAVIYPFADEMMMLFVNGGEQEVIANAA